MIKTVKTSIFITLIIVVLSLVGGAVAIWPFYGFPVSTVVISLETPLLPATHPYALAGIAQRDITTPIGIPKFGYASWAKKADGFRNRLKTRVFYIKPAKGEPAVIVQTDLGAGSLILHHKVAELIASKTDVASHNLTITSTHTHNAPGQYLQSDFYNVFGSNRPGFDPEVFHFLSTQIADAIIEAYNNRRKAKLATGSKEVWGYTKNRSIGAYIHNNNIIDKSGSEQQRYLAVNPTMTMIRIDLQTDQGDYKPAGAITNFSIHGTGIASFLKPYHGDVWAYFERELEWQIKREYAPPWQALHGTFQGTHADNNPAYIDELRGEAETRRIGMGLGAEAWKLFQSLENKLSEKITIRTAAREVNLLDFDSETSNEKKSELCDRALAGTALIGAATGDHVFPISNIPPFKKGWPKSSFDNECHQEKNIAGSFLQSAALDPTRYPHRILLHGAQINDVLIVGVPFEVTKEAGRRIVSNIKQHFTDKNNLTQNNHSIQNIVVSSLSNGFFGYTTTKEEYTQQWYEGGHTIYGPGTTRFLATQSAQLISDLLRSETNINDLPTKWTFNLATHNFFPAPQISTGERNVISPPRYITADSPTDESHWTFSYRDVGPDKINLHEPLISIEFRKRNRETDSNTNSWLPLTKNTILVNDEGYDLQFRYEKAVDEGMGIYEVRWFNPLFAGDDQEYRFVIEARDTLDKFYSNAFF